MGSECLTTLSLTVFTQRNFVAHFFSSEVRFYTKNGRFAFWAPLWRFRATDDDHLSLIEKRVVVDFLLVLIELFFAMRTAEALRASIG